MKTEKQAPFLFQFDEDGEIPSVIQVIPMGMWDHPFYGKFQITEQDISEFKQNFDLGVRKGVRITAGHEVMEEKPAVGWIVEVFDRRSQGLWAKVEWTESGKDLLRSKEFKYYSPEFFREYEDPETRELRRNVMVGGALTNQPYFARALEGIIASEITIKQQFNMDLNEIFKKPVADWSDEEKAAVKANAETLTDEQKEAAKEVIAPEAPAPEATPEPTPEPEPAPAPAPAPEPTNASEIKVSASYLKMLEDKANRGEQAFAELRAAQIMTAVKELTFSEKNREGKFLPKSEAKLKAFIETLSKEQNSAFKALMSELPKSGLFTEAGGADATENSPDARINQLVEKKMSEDKALKYSDALQKVLSENKELAEQYNAQFSA